MTDFRIVFSNAWWLLLLIPAFVLTLISYFKLGKRYRCTRNRIVSIAMHLTVMVLCIALLAGISFEYDEPNTESEVILLVDSSFTADGTRERADEFIKSVAEGCDSRYKLGIVKFGYDSVYAVPLTDNTDRAYSEYLSSQDPDTTATDIASAITYTASLFEYPENARIVLLTDALETDGSVMQIIKNVSAKGIAVDTLYLGEPSEDKEVQIIDAVPSVKKVELNTPFTLDLKIESSFAGEVTVTPYDNKVPGVAKTVTLKEGIQTVSIPYTCIWGGMHVMSYEIAAAGDTLSENNVYCNYVYIETFTEILVIESIPNESDYLCAMLGDELNGDELNVKTVCTSDKESMPATLDELRAYDEVILLNVANKDLSPEFCDILHEYVYTVGGGLFTVCGNDKNSTEDDWKANAYTYQDMEGTVYQKMLPVEIVEYTAPVGVIIIVDTSGSMIGTGDYESSKLYWAMQGAQACLDALSERDYVGIMTLADAYTEELSLTPRTQRDKIMASIAELEKNAAGGEIELGGTIFSAALERAGSALAIKSDIEKRHIILVTDGEPSQKDEANYKYWAEENAKRGVTLSIVGISTTTVADKLMTDLIVNHAGCDADNYHKVNDENYKTLPTVMREDLDSPEIKSVNYEPFLPSINVYNSVTNGIKQTDLPELDGYYGVKLKEGASAVIMGKYTPIYSQWDYGNGRVGTFACDLNGKWSSRYVSSEVGEKLVKNIVLSLFPTESIRISDIDARMDGDNYTTELSIFTNLDITESIKVTVTSPSGAITEIKRGAKESYSRIDFPVKEFGLHTVTVEKLDAEGNTLSSRVLYKAFSYSLEYNGFADIESAEALAGAISEITEGDKIKEPEQVLENALEYLHRVYDPRILFAIIVIALLLVDIAARKFKWKWPHELIRDKKRQREMNK